MGAPRLPERLQRWNACTASESESPPVARARSRVLEIGRGVRPRRRGLAALSERLSRTQPRVVPGTPSSRRTASAGASKKTRPWTRTSLSGSPRPARAGRTGRRPPRGRSGPSSVPRPAATPASDSEFSELGIRREKHPRNGKNRILVLASRDLLLVKHGIP